MMRISTDTFIMAFLLFSLLAVACRAGAAKTTVDVGLVVDATSVVRDSATAVSMGLEDFYKKHRNYTTRVRIHARDSGQDAVGAASVAIELLKRVKVQAILGPTRSNQVGFVIDLGYRTKIPVITFSATTPSLSPTYSPYFVRMALNSSCQVNTIASVVKGFGWRQVIPIYEDDVYGTKFLPYLVDALQDVDARVPYRSVVSSFATESDIGTELNKLMRMQTRVFIVHMLPPLSSSFFLKAKEMGMMSEGYAWIITQGLTDILDTLDHKVINSMHGVLGLKPYVPYSADLENFIARWREKKRSAYLTPTIFDLWAYDTSWAMAMAMEKVHHVTATFRLPNILVNPTDLNTLSISRDGPELLKSILATNFKGISGNFELVNGQLQYSAFQIINIVGSDFREVGFWTVHGTSQNAPSIRSKNELGLRNVTWPGDVTDIPKGWEQNKLKVGVPVKGGFIEFVTTDTKVTGYCIDVFEAVIKSLPYKVHVEYVPYHFAQHPGSYNVLVDQVYFKKFDAIVGDVTIIANRSLYVDFTLPYTESGVSMIVPIEEDRNNSMWIFLKPLTVNLWLATLAFFFGTGFVIWLVEHQNNDEFRGSPIQQLVTIFYFAFSTMVFVHKENLEKTWSKVVVTCWVFVVLILTASYTASLASMLTVQRLQPSVTNINDLLKNGDSVGYQDGSFVRALLEELKFSTSRLKNYSNPDAYEEALSRGNKNGGVSAIIDEIPYIKLFLKKRCRQYVMVGPIHKTGGFGFVFPKGSPLVPDVSKAILHVTQGDVIKDIEKKWFGDQTGCSTENDIFKSNRLELQNFWGLFLIAGTAFILAIFVFSYRFLRDNWHNLKSKMVTKKTLIGKMYALKNLYDSPESLHSLDKHAGSTITDNHDVVSTITFTSSPSMTPNNASHTSATLALTDDSQNSIEPDISAPLPHLPSISRSIPDIQQEQNISIAMSEVSPVIRNNPQKPRNVRL